MEIFYALQVEGDIARLDAGESGHCVRVLRHRAGDEITVVDGLGTMMKCRLVDDSPKGVSAQVLERFERWGGHPYSLNMAVCPTKNSDRFEWFVEKAVELGVDAVSPIIGERSERRVFKADRSRKIALSAMKQSLKARLPRVADPVPVKDFILAAHPHLVNGDKTPLPPAAPLPCPVEQPPGGISDAPAAEEVWLVCYCFEGDAEKRSIEDALQGVPEGASITILIGPEGDFSPEEAALAIGHGFIPVHLGPSRLRTETAAVTAVAAVYLHFLGKPEPEHGNR